MKQILFIGHDASRSGAPFALLYLLRWLKHNAPEYRFELLLLNGGELEGDFRAVCDVHILRRHINGTGINAFASKVLRALRKKAGAERRLLADVAARHDMVLGNTAVTLESLNFFKRHGSKVVCWLHEMDYVLDRFYTPEKFRELASQMDGFIVASSAVREMLVRRGIDRPVNVVYEFLELETTDRVAKFDVRTELGIPADAFVLGGCGTIEWRKGVDLFVQIAGRVIAQNSDAYCLWVGGQYSGTETALNQVRHDVGKLGLGDRVIFADLKRDVGEYYFAMDVFLLPSREDPFPLVCLEAASVERPIVCFQNAGGIPEFVDDDCGFAVPYLDMESAADKILELGRDRQLRTRMGKAAKAKVRSRHDVSRGGPAILDIIRGFQP